MVSSPEIKLRFDTFYNIIDGSPVSAAETRHGINPATKQPNPNVPVASQQDLDNAVEAAQRAFKSWSQTTIEERRAALLAYADAYKKFTSDFAHLLTMEQGKPIAFATAEAEAGYTWITELAKLSLSDEVLIDDEERKVVTRYTPLGVVGAIVPWNFPIQLAVGKIAPAVLAGNTIIVKPSPFTPYCGLKLVELAQRFFPPGVVQALSGPDELGPWMTSHPRIDKISFTGSTATGKRVMQSASATLKRLTLELGGNDPAIVCKSANIKDVAPKVATFAFFNSGQVCVAIKRIYVHESIYKEFRDAVVEYTKSIKVGNGLEEGNFLGPIQNSSQYDRVQGFFDDVQQKGMKIAFGGPPADSKGYFINPTIIDRPRDDSRLVTEEQFGPVIPLLAWSNEEDVIERANNTDMGLGASVWSSDLQEANCIAKRLQAGNVWINTHLDLNPMVPFGGHKQSGIGSEWGTAGLKSYCNIQTLHLKL
ncbi:Aldehyde/histidinol dehydrogenase [Aspergillus carlsbadensis]|nr:Aldehyde/histidinol dehydrogenase [Aspergillus carlsbadensis]